MSVGAGEVAALLLLVFGYDGPHVGRMYIVTTVIAVLIPVTTACVLLARGRSRQVKLNLLILAVPLVLLLLLALTTPFDIR